VTTVEVLVGELVLAGGPAEVATGPRDLLGELVARWLLAVLGPVPSRESHRAYVADIRRWLAWCDEHQVDPLTATKTHGDVYSKTLAMTPTRYGKPPRPATLARMLASVSSFYMFAVDEGLAVTVPIRSRARPKVEQVSTTRGLSRGEAAAFVRRLGHESAFDRAVIRTLLIEGIRVGELSGLNIDSIGVDTGRPVMTVLGKGGKVRTLVLDGSVVVAVGDMLDERARARGLSGGDELPGDEPLFAREDGRRLSQRSAVRILQRVARGAGIAAFRQIAPHVLRHACATLALDSGRVGIHEVRDQLGHAHLTTTERYDRSRGRLSRSAATVTALAAFIDETE
jgi:integrase/recombinase XerD